MSRSRELIVILVTLGVLASARDKERKLYPLSGTVAALKTERVTGSTGVYTDPYGKTRGGRRYSTQLSVFTVHTAVMDYEIEGKGLGCWGQ